jgi:hypothetical protein
VITIATIRNQIVLFIGGTDFKPDSILAAAKVTCSKNCSFILTSTQFYIAAKLLNDAP